MVGVIDMHVAQIPRIMCDTATQSTDFELWFGKEAITS